MTELKCCIQDRLKRIKAALDDTDSRLRQAHKGGTIFLEMTSLRNDLLILRREAEEKLQHAHDAELNERDAAVLQTFTEEAAQHHRHFIDKMAREGDPREVRRWTLQSLDVRRQAMHLLHLGGQ